MKSSFLVVAILAALLHTANSLDKNNKNELNRSKRQTNADQMVQNILQWLQGLYTENSRKVRQGTLREYLPPSNTHKPRPFEPAGYPPSGSVTPQPHFPIYTNPTTGAVTGEGYPSPTGDGYQPPNNDIIPPDQQPDYNGYGSSPPPQPPFNLPGSTITTGGYPGTVTVPGQAPEISTGRPTQPRPGFPTQPPSGTPTGGPTIQPGFPSQPTVGGPTIQPGYTPQQPTEGPIIQPGYPGRPAEGPTTTQPGFTTQTPVDGLTSQPGYASQSPNEGTGPTGLPDFPTRPPTGNQPGFPTQPPVGHPTTLKPSGYPTYQPSGYPSEQPGLPPGATSFPSQPDQPGPSSQYPGYTTGVPGFFPDSSSPLPGQGFTEQPGVPQQPGSPSFPPSHGGGSQTTTEGQGFPTEPSLPGFPTIRPGYGTNAPSGFTTARPGQPGYTTTSPPSPGPEGPAFTSVPVTLPPGAVTPSQGSAGQTTPSPEINTIPAGQPGDSSTERVPTEEDLKHPPHIHDIDVQCAKEMMTINIEFNRPFDGVIYSKGFFNNPECRYVQENTGQTKYSFTVSLNSCGTEFIDAFDTQGQSYLENILVLQNEPGIQEVWDTIRSVRCLWEGNLKESLSVGLSVGMLNQEIITFSGDTAMAKLDVVLGRGPFGQTANGLVKIGEQMTLVVSVSGDPGFDVQVKDCRATDSSNTNVVQLSDDDGCILKPKLFGAFQKSRNTGNTGASIIAYAYFNAFKFPDVMDLMIECNIELCKTDCEMCSKQDQALEPNRRRRRDLGNGNQTHHTDGRVMSKHLMVILPEDLSNDTAEIVLSNSKDTICLSLQNFVFSSSLLICLLVSSCFLSVYLFVKNKRISQKK